MNRSASEMCVMSSPSKSSGNKIDIRVLPMNKTKTKIDGSESSDSAKTIELNPNQQVKLPSEFLNRDLAQDERISTYVTESPAK